MTDHLEAGRTTVNACRRRDPDVADLAIAVAMAVRIEPALLRAARLELAPHVDAGTESDLWFSELVGSRSMQAIVLDRDVAAVLRDDLRQRRVPGVLADRISESGSAWLQHARAVLEAAHKHEPPAIKLEEEIIWHTVRGDSGAGPAIEEAFRRAVKAMMSDTERGMAVARWADRALVTLPREALTNEAARLLAVGTSARLGDRSRAGREGEISAVHGAAWLKPDSPTGTPVEVGVQLTTGTLAFTAPNLIGSVPLTLPTNDARLITIRWQGDDPSGPSHRTTAAVPGQRVSVPATVRTVDLETITGTVYQLAAPAPDVSLRFADGVQDTFDAMSNDLRDAIRRALLNLAEDPTAQAEQVGPARYYHRFGTPPVFVLFNLSGDTDAAGAEQDSEEPSSPAVGRIVDVLEIGAVEPEETEEPVWGRGIFINYSSKDRKWAERITDIIERELQGVAEPPHIVQWNADEIGLTSSWREDIPVGYRRFVVVLVTSSYVEEVIGGSKGGGFHPELVEQVLPVAVSPSPFEETRLSEIQFLNDPYRPLDSLSSDVLDDTLTDIAQKIRAIALNEVGPEPESPAFEAEAGGTPHAMVLVDWRDLSADEWSARRVDYYASRQTRLVQKLGRGGTLWVVSRLTTKEPRYGLAYKLVDTVATDPPPDIARQFGEHMVRARDPSNAIMYPPNDATDLLLSLQFTTGRPLSEPSEIGGRLQSIPLLTEEDVHRLEVYTEALRPVQESALPLEQGTKEYAYAVTKVLHDLALSFHTLRRELDLPPEIEAYQDIADPDRRFTETQFSAFWYDTEGMYKSEVEAVLDPWWAPLARELGSEIGEIGPSDTFADFANMCMVLSTFHAAHLPKNIYERSETAQVPKGVASRLEGFLQEYEMPDLRADISTGFLSGPVGAFQTLAERIGERWRATMGAYDKDSVWRPHVPVDDPEWAIVSAHVVGTVVDVVIQSEIPTNPPPRGAAVGALEQVIDPVWRRRRDAYVRAGFREFSPEQDLLDFLAVTSEILGSLLANALRAGKPEQLVVNLDGEVEARGLAHYMSQTVPDVSVESRPLSNTERAQARAIALQRAPDVGTNSMNLGDQVNAWFLRIPPEAVADALAWASRELLNTLGERGNGWNV